MSPVAKKSAGGSRRKVDTSVLVKKTLTLMLLLAIEAGLGYIGYVFIRTGFLNLWFRILLVAADIVLMLGFVWLINRLMSDQ